MSLRQPQPRENHAAVGVGKKLFVWAGDCGSSKIQTTTVESFDVSSGTWEQPQRLHGSLPDGLYGMAVASDGENAYSFGGRSGSHSKYTYYNTLYEINLSTFVCNELVPRDLSFAPKKKKGSGMVLFESKLVIHGGYTGQDWTDDLHIFDIRTSVWSVQPTTGKKPPPLCDHTFTKIDQHRAVVFGGWSGRTRSELNDAYVLDMEKWHWTKLEISGDEPMARDCHASCCIDGPTMGQEEHHSLLMVVGGFGGGSALCDVWILDVDKRTWSEVLLPVFVPPLYHHSAVVYGHGSNFRICVLFGGSDYNFKSVSETTLLLLEFKEGLWQVTNVVKPDELGRPDESLKEQMRKLELSPKEEMSCDSLSQSTATNDTSSPAHASGAEAKKSPIININEIQMGKRIGGGAFGTVFEAKWKTRRVAAKVCPGNLLKGLSLEIQILSSLPPHPHVLTFFGVALHSDGISTCILTELAQNGSLHDYLHIKKIEPSPDQSLAWAWQIASGMQHLHNNNVVHRDLKSGNVLLAFGLLAKVCDFGTARTLKKTAMTEQKGTYRWMAPEIVADVEANISKMCDVFSYGMVLYEIFAHKIPYADIPSDALAGAAVVDGVRPPVPANLPQFLCPLLEACWKNEPDQRPHFEAIILAIQTGSCF